MSYIQPVPEAVQDLSFPFGVDYIWTIEQHIADLKDQFKENIDNLSEDYKKIVSKDAECDLETLREVYNEICTGVHVSYNLRTIIKYSLVSKLLDLDIIDKNYYRLIIEVAKKIKTVEMLGLIQFCDLVISKYLNLKDINPTFIDLIEGYHFIHQLSVAIKPQFSIDNELYDLVTPIKLYLYQEMKKERNPDNIKNIISMIIQAQAHSADLNIFKQTYEVDVKTWIRWRKIPEDFDFSGLNQDVQLKNFEEIPEDVPDILIEETPEEVFVFEPAVKVKPLYMTHQEAVEVSVWQARNVNGDFIALKECVALSKELLSGYHEEDHILRFLSGKSRNFLKYYGSESKTINIGDIIIHVMTVHMEYVDTTLKQDKLNRDQKNQPYNDYEITNIYKQLVVAFNLLRDLNILHCDIKPSNIMITKNQVIKIIDFNAAKKGINEMTQQISAVGTKDFMSPELRKGLGNNQMVSMKEDKSDVFSLGMTILYLVIKEPLIDLNLYEKENDLKVIINSIKIEWLKPVLLKMLEFNYTKRPGLKELILHFGKDTTVTPLV